MRAPRRILSIVGRDIGLVTKSSIPAARQRVRSSAPPKPVKATTSVCAASPSSVRMAATASRPSITGICTSMKTAANGAPASRCVRTAVAAAKPSSTTVVMQPSFCSIIVATVRFISLSSATRTRRPSSDGAWASSASDAVPIGVSCVSRRLVVGVDTQWPPPPSVESSASGGASWRTSGRSSFTLKVLPSPCVLSAQMWPRCSEAIDLQMDSPRPAPAFRSMPEALRVFFAALV
mmetsp:Transcript_24942/g.58105  ORF Transcript_24942/g.58105 Transcript_24942/m.58105 type:complete len:235 (+) Transcript_24942:219-923(+)